MKCYIGVLFASLHIIIKVSAEAWHAILHLITLWQYQQRLCMLVCMLSCLGSICQGLGLARPWLPELHLESRSDLSLPVRQAWPGLSGLGPVQVATGSQAFAGLRLPPPPGQALATKSYESQSDLRAEPASETGHRPGPLGRDRLIRMLEAAGWLCLPIVTSAQAERVNGMLGDTAVGNGPPERSCTANTA